MEEYKIRCVYVGSNTKTGQTSFLSTIATIPKDYVKNNSIILTQELINTLTEQLLNEQKPTISQIMLISVNFYEE